MSTRLKEWTVLSMLEWGTDYFKDKEIPDPRHSIEWLLAETLQVDRLDLYLKFDRPLSPSELDAIRPLVKRRAAHEPLQYIVGHTDFMNARIRLTPDVLIPRIETEQLCEIILDEHESESDGKTSLRVLDIGTGSGCIPVALKMECPGWELHALDISKEALKIARKNADENNTEIAFTEADILAWQHNDPYRNREFNIIVSNPPYVLPEEKDVLQKQVVNHEPPLALFCDSMEQIYGAIIEFSESHLKKKGRLYLEIHERHSETILSLFSRSHWKTTLQKDYQRKPRFILAQLTDRP